MFWAGIGPRISEVELFSWKTTSLKDHLEVWLPNSWLPSGINVMWSSMKITLLEAPKLTICSKHFLGMDPRHIQASRRLISASEKLLYRKISSNLNEELNKILENVLNFLSLDHLKSICQEDSKESWQTQRMYSIFNVKLILINLIFDIYLKKYCSFKIIENWNILSRKMSKICN